MKRISLIPITCAISLMGMLGCSAGELTGARNHGQPTAKSEKKPVTVTMKSLGFDPKKLEIHVGDSVVWTNASRTTHTATSEDEGKTFNTDEIKPGESSKPVKFEKEGEFKYSCKIHGESMSGTIVVKPESKN
jgi:plastocyanin